ncbi:uncharacterized protein TNCV_3915911 [Trichonephila clavipes]|nr:uncharacterized protein TNCV_3915911 [Trichonephila clavipes]
METRGQRLDPHDCIDYYCNQQGGKGTYFASNYPIQRGYGLFSNLKRYAMPIMIKAGKYLGKHLLTTGQNVLEDMCLGALKVLDSFQFLDASLDTLVNNLKTSNL